MTKTKRARKKLPERHSYDVKSHSNVPKVKRVIGTMKKLRKPKESVTVKEPAEKQECSICLNSINFEYYHTVVCGHSFHTNCINSWLKTANTCPNCRKPLMQPHGNQQQRSLQLQRELLEQRLNQVLKKEVELRQKLDQDVKQEVELQRRLNQVLKKEGELLRRLNHVLKQENELLQQEHELLQQEHELLQQEVELQQRLNRFT